MLEFVQVSSQNGLGHDATAQRQVRSRAMKDYRQRQRAARQAQKRATPAFLRVKENMLVQGISKLAPKASQETCQTSPETAQIESQQRSETSRPSSLHDVAKDGQTTLEASSGSSNAKELDPSTHCAVNVSSNSTSPRHSSRSRNDEHKSLHLLKHQQTHLAFFSSPVAIRTQLLAKFLEIHLLQLPMRAVAGSRWLTLLPSEDLSSPLIQNCIDAVCLAKIGSHHNNQRALQLSSTRYGRTLQLLNQTLTKPHQQQVRADHILVSMSLLALCELFNPVILDGSGRRTGWIKHIKGAESYLLAVGKKAVQSELGQSHLHGVRHFSFVMAMIQRRAVVLADEHWKVLNSKIAALPRDPYVDIYDIALHVPGLLERADRLTNLNAKVEDDHTTAIRKTKADSDHLTTSAILLYDIERILHRLEEWLNKWYAEGSAYIQVSTTMSSYLAATSSLGSLIGFRDAETCTFHQLYWLCSMLLHWTTVELSTNTASCHKTTAYDHALKFLRSVPLCPCAKVGSISRCSIWLSLVLEPYLMRHGYEEEAGWCRSVTEAIEGAVDFTGVRGWELKYALM